MTPSEDLTDLLERAIEAYAYRDFRTASDILAVISKIQPDNWTARYFQAMTLCATGDFSEARSHLRHITRQMPEPLWQKVARHGLEVVNTEEDQLRRSLAMLFEYKS